MAAIIESSSAKGVSLSVYSTLKKCSWSIFRQVTKYNFVCIIYRQLILHDEHSGTKVSFMFSYNQDKCI